MKPDPALLNAAKRKKQMSSISPGPIVEGLLAASTATYLPPSDLNLTYQRLASAQTSYLLGDSSSMAWLDDDLLKFMKSRGQNWTAGDMLNYTVREPRALQVGFAGLTIESFPAPASGGPFLLSLLGNLDFLNTMKPLNFHALLRNDPEETAILLHRLIELSKFAEQGAAGLGDASDPSLQSLLYSLETLIGSAFHQPGKDELQKDLLF
ncbi:unnamed protein product [Echinostoma caproni]|uniref:ELMO domain-containing protein n=1 Tax=Echinostoma caproni TaxID=27848 RepID=A0A183AVP7_9TREM|nr:unnamed protein product [Echinostoma caproni]